MYERLTDKYVEPNEAFVLGYIGDEARARLMGFEDFLRLNYRLVKDMRFPFGDSYGWGYKYSHATKHLCYAFFEQGAFTVTLQLGDREAQEIAALLPELLPRTQELWEGRYPCGEHGGWIHYRVLSDGELNDVIELVKVKKRPVTAGK
jgi:hypothetical protein